MTNLPELVSTNLRIDTMSNQKNSNIHDAAESNISEFYKGSNVFVTGGTGFLGKTLLEKLLRSCEGIENIYVLLRPKRGVEIDERLKKVLKSPVFDSIRKNTPERLEKIRAICGDVGQKNLGLCEVDKNLLLSKVDIVFHSAASIRFNEDLTTSMQSNTFGTKTMIELCTKMWHLQSFVYVSTAYSNPDRTEVEEIVYDPPYDPTAFITCVETLPLDIVTLITPHIIGKHPNTYTLTKNLAESLCLEYSTAVPMAIVRPSIITAAWKEPFPGWVDSFAGATGILAEVARGTVKTLLCNSHAVADWVPVDVVVNTLITAAWHVATWRSNTVKVYNCTSGQLNKFTWKAANELSRRYALQYPSKYIAGYPQLTYRTNRTTHLFYEAVLHYLPAYMRDLFCYIGGYKLINVRICRTLAQAAKVNEFCTLNEWNFHTSNFKYLIDSANKAEDGRNFSMDLSERNGFRWDSYMKYYLLGIRQYLLKDDLSSLDMAKTRLNQLYWAGKAMQIIAVAALLSLRILFKDKLPFRIIYNLIRNFWKTILSILLTFSL